MSRVNHIPLYIFIFLLLLSLAGSYYRFVIVDDYMVGYQANCNQYTEACFIGCKDDTCTEEYYYSIIKKYTPNLHSQCGPNITDCEAAHTCLPKNGDLCEITYCNPTEDGEDACESITEVDFDTESAAKKHLSDTEDGEIFHNNSTEL